MTPSPTGRSRRSRSSTTRGTGRRRPTARGLIGTQGGNAPPQMIGSNFTRLRGAVLVRDGQGGARPDAGHRGDGSRRRSSRGGVPARPRTRAYGRSLAPRAPRVCTWRSTSSRGPAGRPGVRRRGSRSSTGSASATSTCTTRRARPTRNGRPRSRVSRASGSLRTRRLRARRSGRLSGPLHVRRARLRRKLVRPDVRERPDASASSARLRSAPASTRPARRVIRVSATGKDGQSYDQMWQAAVRAAPDVVTITSYNEWHEGTQIEPARDVGAGDLSYDGAWGLHGAQARARVPRPNGVLGRSAAKRRRRAAPGPSPSSVERAREPAPVTRHERVVLPDQLEERYGDLAEPFALGRLCTRHGLDEQ